MILSDNSRLVESYKDVLDNPNYTPIKDSWRRFVTASCLKNQFEYMHQAKSSMLTEAAPANNTAGVQNWDPILINLIRQAMPNLIAYDVCGVQPMSGPTGLIFAMKHKYSTQGGTQALFDEANTAFSGAGTHAGTNPGDLNTAGTYTTGTGVSKTVGETFGRGLTINEMATSIEKVSVTANTRMLKSEYSLELEQDMKAIHGLDIKTELQNILSAEILAEINREIIRTIYTIAVPGAAVGTTTAGVFDLDTDSDGRWQLEKFKTLLYSIERDANAIAQTTRRGKGNIIITTADVASALVQAGMLNYAPALESQTKLTVDDTGNTYAGLLMNRYKVFIDPYASNLSDTHFYLVGYKGTNVLDAGLFYAPYIPLQLLQTTDPNSFAPIIGFKTRYGLVANPHVSATGALTANSNEYYRRVTVTNIM